MKTKTLTLLAVAGGLVYMGHRAKLAAEEAASAIAPPPPPPNGGPVVNGLSFYQLEGLGGFGSKLKKAVKKVSNSKVAKIVTKIDPVAITVSQVKKTVDDPSRLNPLKVASKMPLINRIVPGAKQQQKKKAEPGQEVVYHDARGDTITEAQYNAIVQAVSSGQPVATAGGWALPQGYVSATNPQAQQPQSPPFVPPGHHYGWGNKPSHSREENLTVTNTYSDDYGSTPATAYTASSSGAPGLPGGITTELTTPAAQEAAPIAAPESNTGKLLVGTALAAGAAYLAFA